MGPVPGYGMVDPRAAMMGSRGPIMNGGRVMGPRFGYDQEMGGQGFQRPRSPVPRRPQPPSSRSRCPLAACALSLIRMEDTLVNGCISFGSIVLSWAVSLCCTALTGTDIGTAKYRTYAACSKSIGVVTLDLDVCVGVAAPAISTGGGGTGAPAGAAAQSAHTRAVDAVRSPQRGHHRQRRPIC